MHPDADEAIEQFLEYLRVERNYSVHTVRNYRSDLTYFFRQIAQSGHDSGVAIDFRRIRQYLAQLHVEQRKPATMARKLAALRSFYRFACRRGMVTENPAKLVSGP